MNDVLPFLLLLLIALLGLPYAYAVGWLIALGFFKAKLRYQRLFLSTIKQGECDGKGT